MPAKLTEERRQQIRDLHAEGKSRNEIARQVGVSPSTVTRTCTELDLSFDRSNTQKATEAHAVDVRALRMKLSGNSITAAQTALKLIQERLNKPDDISLRDLGTVYGILTDKHVALDRMDSGDKDLPAVDKWLEHMMGGGQ